MIALFDGGGTRRYTRAQLRARLSDADRKAAKDEAAICELTRHTLRLTRRLQEAETKAASWLRASDELAGRVLEQAAEINALRGEKAQAWATAANETTVDIPAPGDDPQSAFYSGETTAETPLPLWDAPIAQPAPLTAGPVIRVTAQPGAVTPSNTAA